MDHSWNKKRKLEEAFKSNRIHYDYEADSIIEIESRATADHLSLDEALDLASHTAEI